jgi:ketosteroid isomerase-like protein
MVCISAQMDGDQFAFEAEIRGTNTGALQEIAATGRPLAGTGKPYFMRTVTVGRRGSDGKVISHKDYWDAAGYMRQVGHLA